MDITSLHNEFYNNEYRLKKLVPFYVDFINGPNMITVENVDQKLCIEWLEKNYEKRILKKAYHRISDSPIYEELSYLIKGNILIHIHSDIFIDIVFFDEREEKTVVEIADELEKFK